MSLFSFYHYLELHHSQTSTLFSPSCLRFYHYLELHHSQTTDLLLVHSSFVLPLSGITSLSNICINCIKCCFSFTTIWNYITLKRLSFIELLYESFTTIWNYITLKRKSGNSRRKSSFTTIWNYITLKPQISISICVSIKVLYE